jgi:hypothetical protein
MIVILESDVYKYAKSDTQKAIFLPLLLARETGGLLSFKTLQKTYQQFKIKKSAQQVAVRFYKKVVEDEEWLKFPRITTDDIYASHNYYLTKDPFGLKSRIHHTTTSSEKTQNDFISYLQDQVIDLSDDNRALSLTGWSMMGMIDELRGALEEKAETLLDTLTKMFRAMHLEVATTAHKIAVSPPEDVKKAVKILTEEQTEDILLKYSKP